MTFQEVLMLVLTVSTGLLSLVVGLLGWIGKSVVSEVKKNSGDINNHSVDIGVLKASKLSEILDRHEIRLKTLEIDFAEIKGDLRVMSGDVREIRKVVEKLALDVEKITD